MRYFIIVILCIILLSQCGCCRNGMYISSCIPVLSGWFCSRQCVTYSLAQQLQLHTLPHVTYSLTQQLTVTDLEPPSLFFSIAYFLFSGGWVNIKLQLPHLHVSDTCVMVRPWKVGNSLQNRQLARLRIVWMAFYILLYYVSVPWII